MYISNILGAKATNKLTFDAVTLLDENSINPTKVPSECPI